MRDNKRLFDEIGQIALPYLVYAENETFRVNLAKGLAKITHHYLRQSEMQLFPKAVDSIMDMIEEYRNVAGTENIQTIDMYASEISTLEDRFIQLSEKVDAFIKKSNNKSINKGKSVDRNIPRPDIDRIPVITVLSPETPLQGSMPMKGSSLIPCPSCGKGLKRASYKNIDSYYCYKSKGGCGKKYVLGVEDVLVEKTSINKQSNQCQCGQKLNGQGKKEIDGELYQIYACKSPDQGGCGTGYIMDKDGDLHIGRGKIALSRPKISK